MKRLTYNVKRFIYSLKIRRKVRKMPKFMRKFIFNMSMAEYDAFQTLKEIIPGPEELDRWIKDFYDEIFNHMYKK